MASGRFEGLSEPFQNHDRGIANEPLYAADIGPVDTRGVSKNLLRPTLGLSQALHIGGKSPADVHRYKRRRG